MFYRLRLVPQLLLLAFLIVSCQSADSTPTPTPVQWQRVTFLANRLLPGFAMNIPANWHYEVAETGIIIFNYPRLLELQDDGAEMPAGSIVANVAMLSATDVQIIGARNAAGILDAFVGASSSDALGPQYSNSQVVEIRGRDAAQSFVSIGRSDSLLLAMELSGNYVLAVVVAPEGELEGHTDLLNQIFNSVELRLG